MRKLQQKYAWNKKVSWISIIFVYFVEFCFIVTVVNTHKWLWKFHSIMLTKYVKLPQVMTQVWGKYESYYRSARLQGWIILGYFWEKWNISGYLGLYMGVSGYIYWVSAGCKYKQERAKYTYLKRFPFFPFYFQTTKVIEELALLKTW